MTTLPTWEEANGRPFMVQGERVVDRILDDREAKEMVKEMKKVRRSEAFRSPCTLADPVFAEGKTRPSPSQDRCPTNALHPHSQIHSNRCHPETRCPYSMPHWRRDDIKTSTSCGTHSDDTQHHRQISTTHFQLQLQFQLDTSGSR